MGLVATRSTRDNLVYLVIRTFEGENARSKSYFLPPSSLINTAGSIHFRSGHYNN